MLESLLHDWRSDLHSKQNIDPVSISLHVKASDKTRAFTLRGSYYPYYIIHFIDFLQNLEWHDCFLCVSK